MTGADMVAGGPEQRSGAAVSMRRDALLQVATSLVIAGVAVTAYFVLPMTSPLAWRTGSVLVVVLASVSILLVWEIRSIIASPYPAAQALSALVVTVPLFLLGFATAYFLMERSASGSFSEPLSRLDALYFSVTVFATVGFGDIVAKTEAARAVTLLQMVLNLVMVGVIARVVVGAVARGRERQRARRTD